MTEFCDAVERDRQRAIKGKERTTKAEAGKPLVCGAIVYFGLTAQRTEAARTLTWKQNHSRSTYETTQTSYAQCCFFARRDNSTVKRDFSLCEFSCHVSVNNVD